MFNKLSSRPPSIEKSFDRLANSFESFSRSFEKLVNFRINKHRAAKLDISFSVPVSKVEKVTNKK